MTPVKKETLSFIKLETAPNIQHKLVSIDVLENKNIKGFDKAVQDFLIELLTLKGSIKFNKDFGSPFLALFKGTSSSIEDLIVGFNVAAAVIINNNLSKRRHNKDLSELIFFAKLVNVAIDKTKILVTAELTNGVEEKRTVVFVI